MKKEACHKVTYFGFLINNTLVKHGTNQTGWTYIPLACVVFIIQLCPICVIIIRFCCGIVQEISSLGYLPRLFRDETTVFTFLIFV